MPDDPEDWDAMWRRPYAHPELIGDFSWCKRKMKELLCKYCNGVLNNIEPCKNAKEASWCLDRQVTDDSEPTDKDDGGVVGEVPEP